MELREPPRTPTKARPDTAVRALLVVNLLAVLSLAGWLLLQGGTKVGTSEAATEHTREVASKLKAAGALDEAAELFESYLAGEPGTPESRAKIAYSLGTTYLDRGQYERALRWFYEAESLGAGSLAGDVGQKVVHSLERMGRHHAAQAALGSRVRLPADEVQRSGEDPVVARLGTDEIRRSDLDRALDDLPPELARAFADPTRRQEFLKKYVADELLWRKAVKLEVDDDPEVRRAHAALLKQLTVNTFIEREVMSKIEVDEADLRNHFEARKSRFQPQPKEGEEPQPVTFEEVRGAVEQDYRRLKMQNAYNELIESELASENVELFPERLKDAG